MLFCGSMSRRWAECTDDRLCSSSRACTCRHSRSYWQHNYPMEKLSGKARPEHEVRYARVWVRQTTITRGMQQSQPQPLLVSECDCGRSAFLPLASAVAPNMPAQCGSEELRWLARLLRSVELFYNLDRYLQQRLQDATDYFCAQQPVLALRTQGKLRCPNCLRFVIGSKSLRALHTGAWLLCTNFLS